MRPQRILGIVMVVIGMTLLIAGFNASDSVADRFSNFFTGHFTDTTVWYMIGGAAVALGGVLLVLLGGSKRLGASPHAHGGE